MKPKFRSFCVALAGIAAVLILPYANAGDIRSAPVRLYDQLSDNSTHELFRSNSPRLNAALLQRLNTRTAAAGQRAAGVCGDGLPDLGEECDDGNTGDGDGCSSSCQVEVPFECTEASGTSAVADPGFELGGLFTNGAANPFWTESSTTALTPICNASVCLGDPEAGLALEGDHFLWFGGGLGGAGETASVSQALNIPVGSDLRFWSERGICASSGTDNLVVTIDGTPVLTIGCNATDADWVENVVDLATAPGGPYDNGGSHLISFTGTTSALDAGIDFTNIFVDFANVGPITADPSSCASFCGDGQPNGNEECDDGNTANGDGCSAICQVENGFECSAAVGPIPLSAVNDPSFELGPAGGAWTQTFPATAIEPIDSQPPANSGDFLAWFGGIADTEGGVNIASVSQSVTIPNSASTLTYFVQRQICDPSGLDNLEVRLGGNLVGSLACPTGQSSEPYLQYTVDLGTAPGGPYNDGGTYLLALSGTTRGSDPTGTAGDWTNLFVDDVNIFTGSSSDPIASVCTTVEQCASFDFDSGGGDLTGWTLFNAGTSNADWGTTDDGICGSVNWSAGNYTGGAGEAACVDSDAAGSGTVDAYLCSPELSLGTALDPKLDVLANYQIFGAFSGEDLFEILVGTAPPNFLSVSSYTPVFQSTENLGGFLGSGVKIKVPIAPEDGHICFRYRAEFDWYAQIDDVSVLAKSCTASPCVDSLQLEETTIEGTQNYRVKTTLTLGPNLTVDGDVLATVGQAAVFRDNTTIGGNFAVAIDPDVCP